MVRASIAFGIGILLGLESAADLPQVESCWMLLFAVYWLVLKITCKWYQNSYRCLAALAMILLVLAGMTRSIISKRQPDAMIEKAEYFLASIVSPAQLKGKNFRTTLAISRIWVEETGYAVDDRVLWYQDSTDLIQPGYGSKLIFKGSPRPIPPPANPREFDYAGFMARNNIFWNYWADTSDIVMYLPEHTGSLKKWSHRLRKRLKDLLTEYLPAGAPREISTAMLLGDRQAVSDQLEDSFARSGTIHVLAVSGLHLGILYWMLVKLIGAWRRHFLFKWLFLFISLMVLWAFALITGMAASTQRAAAMFSVLILAETIMKQSNTVNNLAASALVILWVEPNQFYSVGFQLSFLALSGILYLQPWLAGWWQLKNRFLRYLWELSTVSISAQLAVLPLSIFYFNQFPVFFLLSNLVVIPLAFSIVVVGVIFFAGLLIPYLTSLLAIPLLYLTKITGYTVRFVADLPNSTILDIQISEYEMFIWYLILVQVMVFLKTRKRLPWLLCLGLLTGLTINAVYQQIQASSRKQLVVYHIPGHTAVDFISGSRFQSVMDPELVSDQLEIDYKISRYRHHLGLQPISGPFFFQKDDGPFGLWMFQGKRLLLIRAPLPNSIGKNVNLKSHIVVVSNDSIDELRQLLSWIEMDLLVIDGSNVRLRAKKLQEQAYELGLEVHNCWENGYRIINL